MATPFTKLDQICKPHFSLCSSEKGASKMFHAKAITGKKPSWNRFCLQSSPFLAVSLTAHNSTMCSIQTLKCVTSNMSHHPCFTSSLFSSSFRSKNYKNLKNTRMQNHYKLLQKNCQVSPSVNLEMEDEQKPVSALADLGVDLGVWSIVIPTYNRLPILTKCLQALEEQVDASEEGVKDYEVVVVDDGSTDGTCDFLQSNSSKFPHVRLLLQNHGGATMARNFGVSSSRGSTIVFIDSDMVVAKDFSNPMLWLLKKHTVKMATTELFSHSPSPLSPLLFPLLPLLHPALSATLPLPLPLPLFPIFSHFYCLLSDAADFLKSHALALKKAYSEDGDDQAFSYGRVVNTANFDDPRSEKFKITDYSAAFFATGNVAISRRRLLNATNLLPEGSDGPFDADFSEYGWEDLELGERLRQQGVRIIQSPDAVGYHYHPAFTLDQLEHLIEQERQRGRNGVRFYRKHPNLNVRLMIQMTPFHEVLWFILTIGGLVNEKTLKPFLRFLVHRGHWRLALAFLSPVLNWHTVQALKEEMRRKRV